MADIERLYQEYLKVLPEPDSPHKRRVMRRIQKALRDPSTPYDSKYVINFDEPGLPSYGDVTATIGDIVEAKRLALLKLEGAIEQRAKRNANDEWMHTYGHKYPLGRPVTERWSPDEDAVLGIPQIGQRFRAFGGRDPYSGAWTSPVVSLDIETGKGFRPLSISAVKGYINKNTGEFFYTEGFERYYIPQDPSDVAYNMALETHKITRARALAYRQLQGAEYPEVYTQSETDQLLEFLKGAVVVGQNILNFDFEKLGIVNAMQNFRTIDSMLVAENLEIPEGKRNLEDLYRAFTGITLKQAGYEHHFGYHDVLSTMELMVEMYRMANREGRDIKYIMSHPGVSYAPFEWVHNSSVVTGGYRRALEVKNYMEGETINEQMGIKIDENGNVISAPPGISVTDPAKKLQKEHFDAETGATSVAMFQDAMIDLTTALNQVKETMSQYVSAGYTPLEQFLSNRSPAAAMEYMATKNVSEKTRDAILEHAGILRADKAIEKYGNIEQYVKDAMYTGKLSEERGSWYLQEMNQEGGSAFTPGRLKRMITSDMRREAYDKRMEAGAEDQIWWDIKNEYDLNKFAEHLNAGWNDEAIKKKKYIDKAERAGLLWGDDVSRLRSSAEYLAGSYDDLVDATDDVIKKNQELLDIYEKIGQIKPYDINQLISAARGQWNGITGAAGGVIPKFILNPVSRLGDAAFNAIDRSVSPWNAVQRTWNSGIGNAVTGALTAGMGPVGLGIGMALTGGVNAISQAAGNAAQSKLEMAGLAIQNNLNVLGAMVSWIATPFQLLHRAAKTLIGSFSGLSLGINKLMQNSIGLMSQMGNPLEQLTGIGYGSYLGTTAVDMATLNRSGTLNNTIEDFAQQSRALYGLGQVNTTRMIAASMLGVFDSMYTPTTDSAGAYYNTANKILRSMQGQTPEQQANTLYWATNIDSYMAGLVRTAMLLGETDVRNFADPSRSGMYWNPLGKVKNKNGEWVDEEAMFRRTQYEFGSATQQFNFSKMRLGNRLWEAVGKDLYNGFNRLVDAAAGGDWKGVLEEAKNMWEMLKEKVKSVWESMTGGKEGTGFWGKFTEGFNKASEAIVTWGAKVAKTIISVWDDIFLAVLEKAQGLISYLSTVHLGIVRDKDSPLGFSLQLSSIKDAPDLDYGQRIFDTKTSNQGPYSAPRKGMEGLALLAKQLLPNLNPENSQGLYQNVTAQELMYLVGRKILSGESIDLPEYYLEGWNEKSADAARDLLESIYKADNWEYGDTRMAAMGSSRYARKYITGETGYYQIAKTTLKDELEPIVDTIIDRSAEKLTIRLEISDASGSVKQSIDVNKGGVADSGFLTWLQDLLPDNLRLKVVTH